MWNHVYRKKSQAGGRYFTLSGEHAFIDILLELVHNNRVVKGSEWRMNAKKPDLYPAGNQKPLNVLIKGGLLLDFGMEIQLWRQTRLQSQRR